MSAPFDAIVIGAGHNGLICALELARGGRRVLVVESAAHAGGAAITRNFAPGFKVSACAHLLHALPQSVLEDYTLEQHGLKFAARAMPTHALSASGEVLRIGAQDIAGNGATTTDSAQFPDFRQRMMRYAGVLHSVMGITPPRLSLTRWSERFDLLRLGLRIRLLGKKQMRELLRIGGMNAYDLLDDNFTGDLLKGALAFDATLGAEYGPRSPGTVLTWLYRLAGEHGSGTLGLAQPAGGMGAFSDALAAACKKAGVEIRLSAPVQRILVANDHASGVRLVSGEEIPASTVISSADLRTTFFKLLGTEHLDTGFVRRVDHFRARGLVAKLHLALRAQPVFKGVDEAALRGRLLISPSMDYLELAFNPSKYCEVPTDPAMEITLPSLNDSTLAPPGQHVLSALLQFVPYDLGPDPVAARADLLENTLATLERHAPGIRQLVMATELLTPSDLEREFGLAGGHWHQGALSFDQFFVNRPVPQSQQYQSPVPGLFMCGAACHPGGSVMGYAGRNAARAVLAQGV